MKKSAAISQFIMQPKIVRHNIVIEQNFVKCVSFKRRLICVDRANLVKILIDNKADVDALNDDDQSALSIAAARGESSIVSCSSI